MVAKPKHFGGGNRKEWGEYLGFKNKVPSWCEICVIVDEMDRWYAGVMESRDILMVTRGEVDHGAGNGG